MKTFFSITFLGLIIGIVSGCSSHSEQEEFTIKARPEVTVSSPAMGIIRDSVALSSRVRFLNNNMISSPLNGYIKEIKVKPGDFVQKDQVLLTLNSKEASVLAESNSAQHLGSVSIKASSSGQIVNISHFSGDYVQEGTMLAEIAKPGETYLEIYVPFRYRSFIHKKQTVVVQLSSHFADQATAVIQTLMSSANSASQTAIYLAKINTSEIIPEGLMLTTWLHTDIHPKAVLLPKEAVLANEELTSFWVMKMVNDSLAVKVPIHLGISTEKKIELINTSISTSTRIIISGQYGLEDSTFVHIQGP